MPELPEVHTVSEALKPFLLGHSFKKIEIFIDKLRYPLAPLLDKKLLNTPVTAIRRRARYIVIEFANLKALVIHLGMTGVFRQAGPGDERLKHEHVIFHLDDGRQLRFECTRRFSSIVPCIVEKPGAEPECLLELGVEPLSKDFTAAQLYKELQQRRGPVKVALMDNAIVVGIGNIYAAETLFKTGIDPARPANKVTKKECAAIVKAAKAVLSAAIEAGGTTFSDYRQLDGTEGYFFRELQVYGRKGEPCVICDTPIETITQGGRTTFYCPKCQR